MQWPARSRLIPLAANSIKISVARDEIVIADKLLVRSGETASSQSALIEQLPPGTVVIRAQALPSLDGSGTPQAEGTKSATLEQGKTTIVSLTLGSTIDRVVVSPTEITTTVNSSAVATATALDSSGAVVLTHPSKWTWSTAAPGVSLNPSGSSCSIAASQPASGTITAKELESGKTTTFGFQASITPVSKFTITRIEPTSYFGFANAINESGEITGAIQYQLYENMRAYIWSPIGGLRFLEPELRSAGENIREDGAVVGYYQEPGSSYTRAALWRPDGTKVVVHGEGSGFLSNALDINDQGTIVGYVNYGEGSGEHIVDWDTELKIHELWVNIEEYNSMPKAINKAGTIAGWRNLEWRGAHLAFRIKNGAFQDLHPPGYSVSDLLDMNEKEQACGYVYDGQTTLAGFWSSDGSFKSLGEGGGFAINEVGDVAGFSYETRQAILWTSDGRRIVINPLLTNGAGWSEIIIYGINSSRQMVGSGTFEGHQHPILISPAE